MEYRAAASQATLLYDCDDHNDGILRPLAPTPLPTRDPQTYKLFDRSHALRGTKHMDQSDDDCSSSLRCRHSGPDVA